MLRLRSVSFLIIFLFFQNYIFCQSQDSIPTITTGNLVSDTIPPADVENNFENEGLLIQGANPSFNLPDSVKTDSIKTPPPKGDIETTVFYSAKDSIFFDLQNQDVFLYGEGKIEYGDIKLEAERIQVNWVNKTIKANYVIDSLGNKKGKPVFSEESDVYETEDMIYNFKTRKAIITGVVTEQDGAFMHGELVKKNAEDEMFIRNAGYTTCDLADPHFHIQSETLKLIPGKQIVSGPFNLRFRDIPTFLWLPFGMFPQPKSKTSGIIVPSYGEERRRGFFLRDGGYYFAINDYLDLKVTGDIYSKGGFAINAASTYKWRYHFSGNYSFSYLRNIIGTGDDAIEQTDWWVRWSHSPQTRGSSSLSASVNLGSGSYNTNNNQAAQDFSRNITSRFNSSVSYRKTFKGTPWNLSSNLRHNQDVSTGKVNMTLPEFTLNMNRIYPLKKVFKNSKNPFGKISISHSFNARNEITNIPTLGNVPFDLVEAQSTPDTLTFNDDLQEIFRRGKYGGKHTVPITTSFSMFKYFTISPSVNYEETWYLQRLQYTYDAEAEAVNIDTLQQFERLSGYSLSASMNTTLYGMLAFAPGKKISAIRHVMQPSVSFSYRPEQRDKFLETVQVDNEGTVEEVDPYEGFLFGTPGGAESKSMSFSLRNNIEMKVRSDKDTVNEYTKVKIFDNLSLSSSYNFAADSFNLNDITWNARTSLFKNAVSVALNGTIDPYNYILISETFNEDGSRTVSDRRIDQYAWQTGNGIGSMKNIAANISFSLKPKGSKKDAEENESDYGRQGELAPTEFQSDQGTEEELAYINANPQEYVDFSIPWSMNVGYNISRNKIGFRDATINQTMRLSGNVSITEKTKINFSSNYDIEENQFTATRIGITRDLHCWVLDFNWVPFGRFQSYNVSLRVRAAVLKDLKLEKRRSFQDLFGF